jgi:hypothetical protein
MHLQIRKAQAGDGPAILEIILPVIREGATYTLDANMSEADPARFDIRCMGMYCSKRRKPRAAHTQSQPQ